MVAQIINALLGIWLMSAPALLMYGGTPADNDYCVGPVVAAFAIIAMSECTRAVSHYNLPMGLWLILAPWVLGYDTPVLVVNSLAVGCSIVFFSFFKRKSKHAFHNGWAGLWKKEIG